MPGVLNSATEYMTPEIWRQLLTSPQTKWLVNKHREVRGSLTEGRWLEDPDFQEYARCMSKSKTREAKAFAACKDDGKRVEMWCNSLKRRLPYVIFVATYPKRSVKEGAEPKMWRNQKFALLNGLCVMDIDHVDAHPLPLPTGGVIEKPTPQDYYNVWRETHPELFANQTPLLSGGAGGGPILLVYITPSGKGLKIVFKADVAKGNLIDNQHQMAKLLGVEVDESCKDASRMSFICKESDILYLDK